VGCGVGGDLFAIVWDGPTRTLHGYNGSGRSPAGLSFAQLQTELAALGRSDIPPHGVLPLSVPGAVDGWFALHGKFGKLPMAEVLAPAIALARAGHPVPELIAHYWQLSGEALARQPNFAATFLPGGRAPRKGEVFRNPDLARTYERLAAGGRAAFYEREIADAIDRTVRAAGGYLTKADLQAHRGEWVAPISTMYRGYRVYELPPNGQGLAALQMLEILEGFDLRAMGFGSAEYLHTLVEAKKLAFADRARWYADPAFSATPVRALLAPAYTRARRALISGRAARSVDPGNVALRDGDTTYLTVADRHGTMVSLIQSNYRGMGSGVVPEGTGFGLQDRGQLFSMTPGQAHTYAPSKRPFHTIIPAFVTRGGEPFLAFGVMGGAAQPQMHVQVLVNVIDFGMNLQEAGDAPRLLHEGSSEPTGEVMRDGGTVYLETGFTLETVRGLLARGHQVAWARGPYGGYQAIGWDAGNRVYVGASESRKDGLAAGY
jgi:gamma-glutamyltranspeptidase/glutathione hydrolase